MAGWFSGSGGGGGTRSWQSSLDSIKNQVSTSLREVVDAVAVDPSTLNPEDSATVPLGDQVYRVKSYPDILKENHADSSDQLEVAVHEISRLQAVIDTQVTTINTLTSENKRITFEKDNSEKQKEIQISQFRELLLDKEEEINQLIKISENSVGGDDNCDTRDKTLGLDKIKDLESKIHELENRLQEEEMRHADKINEICSSTDINLNNEIEMLKKENIDLCQQLRNLDEPVEKNSKSTYLPIQPSENLGTEVESDENIRLKEENSIQANKVSELEEKLLANATISKAKDTKLCELNKVLDEKDDSINNYMNICDDLHIKVNELTDGNSAVLEQLNSIKFESDSLKQKLSDKCTEVATLNDKYNSINEKYHDIHAAYTKSEESYRELNDRFNEIVAESKDMKTNIFSKESEINDAAEAYQELTLAKTKERDELLSEIHSQKTKLEDNLNTIESLKNAKNDDICMYEDKIQNLQSKLEALKLYNNDLNNQDSEAKVTIARLDSVDNTTIIDELNQTKITLDKANETILHLETKIQHNGDSDASKMKEISEKLKTEYDILKGESLVLRKQLETSMENMENIQFDYNKLRDEHDILTEENIANKNNHNKDKEKHERLEKELLESIEKLEIKVTNLNQTSVDVATKLEHQHQQSIESISNEYLIEVRALEQKMEHSSLSIKDIKLKLENQHRQETSQLELAIKQLQDEKEEMKKSNSIQKTEIEKLQCIVENLKEANSLMKEHANDSVAISEQYQQNLQGMQQNLKVYNSFCT